MMQIDTGGKPIIFYDGCSCCRLSTGGQHEIWCPVCQKPEQWRVVAIAKFLQVANTNPNAPCKDMKIADRISKIPNIKQVRSRIYDDNDLIKEIL